MRVSHDKAPHAERKDVDIPDSDFLSAVRAIREPTSFSAELALLALPSFEESRRTFVGRRSFFLPLFSRRQDSDDDSCYPQPDELINASRWNHSVVIVHGIIREALRRAREKNAKLLNAIQGRLLCAVKLKLSRFIRNINRVPTQIL